MELKLLKQTQGVKFHRNSAPSGKISKFSDPPSIV